VASASRRPAGACLPRGRTFVLSTTAVVTIHAQGLVLLVGCPPFARAAHAAGAGRHRGERPARYPGRSVLVARAVTAGAIQSPSVQRPGCHGAERALTGVKGQWAMDHDVRCVSWRPSPGVVMLLRQAHVSTQKHARRRPQAPTPEGRTVRAPAGAERRRNRCPRAAAWVWPRRPTQPRNGALCVTKNDRSGGLSLRCQP
jgi:hypothetical protein